MYTLYNTIYSYITSNVMSTWWTYLRWNACPLLAPPLLFQACASTFNIGHHVLTNDNARPHLSSVRRVNPPRIFFTFTFLWWRMFDNFWEKIVWVPLKLDLFAFLYILNYIWNIKFSFFEFVTVRTTVYYKFVCIWRVVELLNVQ